MIGADGENQILLSSAFEFLISSIGAHSWVGKASNIAMRGKQTEPVWGVIDLTPNTDFPDIRNKCVIHSNNGTLMLIPREGDKIRLFSCLMFVAFFPQNPTRLFFESIAWKSFYPYTFQTPEFFYWWTVYIGTSNYWGSLWLITEHTDQLDKELLRDSQSKNVSSSSEMHVIHTPLKVVCTLKISFWRVWHLI